MYDTQNNSSIKKWRQAEQLSLLNLKVIVPTSGSLSLADEVLQKRVCLTQSKFREGQLPGHFCDLSCRLESNSIDERVTRESLRHR